MYPILLCSITALAIFIERLWNLRWKHVIPQDFIDAAEQLIRREKIPDAAQLCKQNSSAMARILLVGIKNFGRKREVIKEHLEEVGRQEGAALERFVEGLGMLVSRPEGSGGRRPRKDRFALDL